MIDLKELEGLERAATPGPWEDVGRNVYQEKDEECEDPIAECDPYADAAFIAAARNALPALIRELKAAREVVKMADNATRFFDEDYPSYVGPLRGALAAYDEATKQ